jgi:hypothetical protein
MLLKQVKRYLALCLFYLMNHSLPALTLVPSHEMVEGQLSGFELLSAGTADPSQTGSIHLPLCEGNQ